MSCLQGDVRSCSEGVRAMLGPYETCVVRVIRTGTATQEHRKKLWKRAVEICNSIAAKEEEHPYVFIYTPIPNRQKAVSLEGSDGVEPDVGDSVGSFMLAQLVKKMPAVKMSSTLSRSAIKIRVAYADEIEPEKVFSFPEVRFLFG